MKFLIKTILIITLIYLFKDNLPWWALTLVVFTVNISLESTLKGSFFSGFLGTGLVWGVLIYYINQSNNSVLADKVSSLFQLPHASYLLIISILLGALLGGISGMSGYYFRQLFKTTEENPYN